MKSLMKTAALFMAAASLAVVIKIISFNSIFNTAFERS